MVDTGSEMVSAALSTFDEMHAVLRRHPSVAIWNFGSQPSVANVDKLCTALVRRARDVDPSRIAHLGNAAIAYERHDDTHPTRSFFWARADADRFAAEHGWRRDNHMYPGWYFGDLATIEELPREDFGLVTEFGGQSLPDREMLAEFMDVDGPVDWRAIARHCGQPELLRRHNPDATTLDELSEHSQRHQAALVRHHTEFIRGRKGDPGRGLHVFAFTDCWPSVTWSVIDYRRRPKPAYQALATAMSPVLAILTDAAHPVSPGDRTLEIRIVNDGPRDLHDAMLEVQVADSAATETHRVPLDTVPTDRALRREVDVRVPPGRARIAVLLTLRWDGGSVTNRYDVDVRD
jgi:beta-mannosidase